MDVTTLTVERLLIKEYPMGLALLMAWMQLAPTIDPSYKIILTVIAHVVSSIGYFKWNLKLIHLRYILGKGWTMSENNFIK